jgi:hypothetical protein
MDITTHTARIIGPVPYLASGGKISNIPVGPCLVERIDGHSVDIIWGAQGQSCAALPLGEVEAAEGQGHLVLLD